MNSAPDTRNDGALVNALSGMGMASKDRSISTEVRSNRLLTEPELEALYLNGVPRRYVDAIPNEILRHVPTLQLGGEDTEDDQDLITEFETYLQATQFDHALAEVIKLQRLYGGAGLVLLLDDGLDPAEPVDIKRLRAVRDYIPLSRHELLPEDYTITDYSKPEHYRITTSQKLTPDQQGTYVNMLIHHSRVARFDGLYLPWNMRARNTGWGQSVLQQIWDAFKRYETAMAGLESMTGDADLFIHKIPGLFQRIAAGNESDLRKRLEANTLSRSVYGGMVVDTEEELNYLNRALSNIASATEPFIKDLQAATGWPASILMGDSPGGLGKEGRFEERVWASLVEQWQETYCRTPITEVFTYILASREGPTRGRMPESWKVHFPSCFTQTDKEKADLRQQVMQADVQYIQLGVLNPLEVRQSRFGGTEYSMETKLNEVVTQQMAVTADAQFQAQIMGMQVQRQAAQGRPPQPEGAEPTPGEGTEPAPGNEASPEEANPEGGIVLPEAEAEDKRFQFDSYDAQGLRIRVTHRKGDVRIGYLIDPDNQRTDTSAAAPLMVFGPHRTKAYKLYRARFDVGDELLDGPYLAGFASLKSAKRCIAQLYPRQTVAGLSALSEAEIEALRSGWGAY